MREEFKIEKFKKKKLYPYSEGIIKNAKYLDLRDNLS